MTNIRACLSSVVAVLSVALCIASAHANPALVIDVDSGEVLYQDMATAPWFPASLTKLMTTYVALSKAREGKISMDTPLRVSARAARMAPSKMGFRPGTLVTLDNALKMLMVKSPNDVAVTIAEGVSGSVEAFADEMNAYAVKLGLHESHFANPNGLPNPDHISSARDMALIGRALLLEFPEDHALFGIPALDFGGRIINNHNGLLGRYPGVDGMKTGFTCSAGYNLVASAQRGDKRLIVVIMGAPSVRERTDKAAALFERFFSSPGNGSGSVAAMPASDIVLPPDLRGQVCGPGRRDAIAEAEADDAGIVPLAPAGTMFGKGAERADLVGMAAAAAPAIAAGAPAGLLQPRMAFVPVKVFIGPVKGWTGPVVGSTELASAGPKTQAAESRSAPTGQEEGSAIERAASGPLALAGAVQPAPAVAAANKIVKNRGRLSLRATARHQAGRPKPARIVKAPAKAKAKAARR